jgi:hypothetical protein
MAGEGRGILFVVILSILTIITTMEQARGTMGMGPGPKTHRKERATGYESVGMSLTVATQSGRMGQTEEMRGSKCD